MDEKESSIHTTFMQAALDEARDAVTHGDVPVGAVAVYNNTIIARAGNQVEQRHDATLHAEIVVLQLVAAQFSDWRLSEIDLYVTLEPCPMCASALMLSRVRRVFFGAKDERMGAYGSLFDLGNHPALPQPNKIYGGLLENECRELLQTFFRCRREQS